MRLRDEPTLVATDLYDLIAPPHEERLTTTDLISVDLLQSDPEIHVQSGTGRLDIPATGTGLIALGDSLNIPAPFLGRLDADVQHSLLNALLSRSDKEVVVQYDGDGVQDVVPANNRQIEPRKIIEIACRIVGDDATVVEWRKDNTGYGFDIVVSPDRDVNIGGDPAVGDVTRGGLRFGQDLKHNLAPYVSRYLYRLICTNGMETAQVTKVNARGADTDQIVEALEAAAWEAFAKLDIDLHAFYALRDQDVDRPESTLARIAGEHGLSDRTLANLVLDLPEYVDENGHATMFDLVNLVTNYANDEAFANRWTARRTLELAGGRIAHDHAARCPQCRSRLSRS